MIRTVRASGLGVSSTSTAHTCPAYGLPSMDGQWISASGTCPPRPAAGWLARSRRSECHHAWPSVQAGPAVSHSRAARTARMCASRPSEGRRAGNPSPVAVIPSRVSQHHPGPGPEPAGGRVPGPPPPARDRGQPGLLDAQRGGEQIKRRAVVLADEQEPVDVPLGQPDRPGVSAARRAGRGDECRVVCCAVMMSPLSPQ